MGRGLRAGVFGRARLRASLSHVSSSRRRLRYDYPSKIGRVQKLSVVLYAWGGRRSRVLLTKLLISLCTKTAPRTGELETRGWSKVWEYALCLSTKSPLVSPSAYLTFCSSRDSLDERITTHCLLPDLLREKRSARPTDMTS